MTVEAQQQSDLGKETAVFKKVWEGGYYEGDPLDPMGRSGFGVMGYMNVLHAAYLMCIRPYIKSDTVALEIGPGRGAWTRGMLGAKELWVMDAKSAEINCFWEYIGNAPQVKYFQVSDFSCSDLPDNHFDYFFSFGTFCHISEEGRRAYFENLYRKLKPGANCFVMISNKEIYNRAVDQVAPLNMIKPLRKSFGFKLAMAPLRLMWELRGKAVIEKLRWVREDEHGSKEAGVHYHDASLDGTCALLEKIGYRVIDKNVGAVPRDPIIHYVR